MPVPPVPTALALLPVLLLIAAAELARARRTRPAPDVYEPGDQLSPAEVADIEAAGFEPVYLPEEPASDKAWAAEELQAEALAAEARLAARSKALDDQLHRLDRHLATISTPNPHRAALAMPAPTSPRKEPTAP
ncbi:hypothetical protein [Kitasatospora sp. NBC_01300]|uniref:hypothetical protein n=1 Tax=Kitasatospora sp. NBC_01300 TaxID=2903574 RepID=UPI002F915245|nr:hypothetical protein OG556_40315 [Kitasatospora sp. NBC_01300]